jgi:methylmalonyl-CoA mutase N-terminal domain/subunit
VQREIQEAAFATQREVESGRRIIVGVNRFGQRAAMTQTEDVPHGDPPPQEPLREDPPTKEPPRKEPPSERPPREEPPSKRPPAKALFETAAYPVLRVNPALEAAQIARIKQLRAERDGGRAAAALAAVEQTARGSGNLLPPIVAAVEALATIGEISDCLRGVFGEHKESVVI